MNKKYIHSLFLAILFLTSINILSAQFLMNGNVKDIATGEVLIGANIFLASDFSIGSQSDLEGNFNFNVEAEKGTLIVSYIGYKDQVIEFASVATPIQIAMQAKVNTIEEVIVKGNKLTGQVFAVEKINQLDIYLNPSAQADALKAVQSNAAATTVDETANVSLRGSPASETGVFLNNVPINDVVRLDQTNGVGQFSIFNTNTIESVSVFPSNPPLEFGNTTSGVVALYTTDRLPKKTNSLSLNLVGIGASFSRKLGQKSSVSTFSNWNNPYLLKEINPTSLKDLNTFTTLDFGVYGTHQFNKNWQLKYFNYVIKESYQYQVRFPDFEDKFQQSKQRNQSIINLIQQKENTRLEWNQGINFSDANYQIGNINIGTQNFDYFSGLNYAWYPENGSVKMGINTSIHRIHSLGTFPQYAYALSKEQPTISFDTTHLIILPEAFIYNKWTLANKLTVGIGGRFHPKINQLKAYGSYQLNIAYNINDQHHLIASIGQYHKYQLPSSEQPFITKLSSKQFSFDYRGRHQYWEWSAAVYQKNNLRADTPNTIQGAEVYTAYKGPKLQWSISLASIQSTIKTAHSNYPSDHDISYFLRTMLKYSFVNNWDIGLVYWQRQGRYYLPVTSSIWEEGQNTYRPIYAFENEGLRLPDYHRLDFSISRIIGLPFGTAILYANANNLLDTKNVRAINYNADYSKEFAEYLNRRTVFFGVVINWE